jgi:hypothetical protein
MFRQWLAGLQRQAAALRQRAFPEVMFHANMGERQTETAQRRQNGEPDCNPSERPWQRHTDDAERDQAPVRPPFPQAQRAGAEMRVNLRRNRAPQRQQPHDDAKSR